MWKKIFMLLIWIILSLSLYGKAYPTKGCYMKKYNNEWVWYNPDTKLYIIKYKNKTVWFNPKTNTVVR